MWLRTPYGSAPYGSTPYGPARCVAARSVWLCTQTSSAPIQLRTPCGSRPRTVPYPIQLHPQYGPVPPAALYPTGRQPGSPGLTGSVGKAPAPAATPTGRRASQPSAELAPAPAPVRAPRYHGGISQGCRRWDAPPGRGSGWRHWSPCAMGRRCSWELHNTGAAGAASSALRPALTIKPERGAAGGAITRVPLRHSPGRSS